jgi:predicted  nucleic acid-binding Zn-ribbon protein
VNSSELALHHQRLSHQASLLRSDLERVNARLAGDPEVRRLEDELEHARHARRELELRLRASEREAGQQRQRMQDRRRELMSGRINNGTELMKLSDEVDRLKVRLGQAEDAELAIMEDVEVADRELGQVEARLDAARRAGAAGRPELEARRDRDLARAAELEAERDQAWERLPTEWRRDYERLRVRLGNPVAEVVGGQCQGCHVSVTSNGMQILRRGGIVHCDNCDRLLVVT